MIGKICRIFVLVLSAGTIIALLVCFNSDNYKMSRKVTQISNDIEGELVSFSCDEDLGEYYVDIDKKLSKDIIINVQKFYKLNDSDKLSLCSQMDGIIPNGLKFKIISNKKEYSYADFDDNTEYLYEGNKLIYTENNYDDSTDYSVYDYTDNSTDDYSDDSLYNNSDNYMDDIQVSAEDLCQEYEDNEVKADKTYKDQSIEVTGEISDISSSNGEAYIVLSDGSDYSVLGVQCFFYEDSEIDKIADLDKGDTVTLVGTCEGNMGNVVLNSCYFE